MKEAGSLPNARERNIGLDLVRAVAILLVMVSHWAHNIGIWYHYATPQPVFFAGDVGVDLFFALSGFLIGRILLGIIENAPTWRSIGIFLVRRWMRTLPLYWLWLLVLAVFQPHAPGVRTIGQMAVLMQNVAWQMPPGFFFAVSWSLTVEEWFYLSFGVALLGSVLLIGRRGAVWPVLAVFLSVPLALRLTVPAFADWSNGLSHAVVFCLDSICYGVLVAVAWRRQGLIFRHPKASLVLGLSLIGAGWADLLPIPSHLLLALIPNVIVIGCALCLPAAIGLRLERPRAAAVVRQISAQSYGLYVMHLTILADVAQHLYFAHDISRPAAVLLGVGLPFCFIVAELSFFRSTAAGHCVRHKPTERLRRKAGALCTPTSGRVQNSHCQSTSRGSMASRRRRPLCGRGEAILSASQVAGFQARGENQLIDGIVEQPSGATGKPVLVDTFSQPQAHKQSFTGAVRRSDRLVFGAAVAPAFNQIGPGFRRAVTARGEQRVADHQPSVSAGTDAGIILVAPVGEIMPAFVAWPGVVGDFVGEQAVTGGRFRRGVIKGRSSIFIRQNDVAAPMQSFIGRPRLDGELVEGEMVGCQRESAIQLLLPVSQRLVGAGVDQVEGQPRENPARQFERVDCLARTMATAKVLQRRVVERLDAERQPVHARRAERCQS